MSRNQALFRSDITLGQLVFWQVGSKVGSSGRGPPVPARGGEGGSEETPPASHAAAVLGISLAGRFGGRYRVGRETASKSPVPRVDSDRPRIGAKLRSLPCALSARGDMETVITFHVDTIKQVLALLKPYRRRQVSEGERVRLQEMGIRNRFTKTEFAA